MLLSRDGRSYRHLIGQLVMTHPDRARLPLRGRLSVEIVFYQKDQRRRDLDNLLKCTLDAMQHAGVYPDDAHIDALRITRQAADITGLWVEVSEIVHQPDE